MISAGFPSAPYSPMNHGVGKNFEYFSCEMTSCTNFHGDRVLTLLTHRSLNASCSSSTGVLGVYDTRPGSAIAATMSWKP